MLCNVDRNYFLWFPSLVFTGKYEGEHLIEIMWLKKVVRIYANVNGRKIEHYATDDFFEKYLKEKIANSNMKNGH